MGLKEKVYFILLGDTRSSPLKNGINGFIGILIVLNLFTSMMETVHSFRQSYGQFLFAFEVFSVFIFTLEYIFRFWASSLHPKFKQPYWGRLKFFLSPLAIIDLLAILPFYLWIFIPYDLRFLRALRLMRILRILKLARYSKSISFCWNVLRKKRYELAISGIALLILLFVSSSLIYIAEHDSQPDKFPNIPETLWWGVVTLSTIGYGDVYPVTFLGKFLTGIVATLGLGLFAIPAGVLASGFFEEFKDQQEKENVCPHCGKNISEESHPTWRHF